MTNIVTCQKSRRAFLRNTYVFLPLEHPASDAVRLKGTRVIHLYSTYTSHLQSFSYSSPPSSGRAGRTSRPSWDEETLVHFILPRQFLILVVMLVSIFPYHIYLVESKCVCFFPTFLVRETSRRVMPSRGFLHMIC